MTGCANGAASFDGLRMLNLESKGVNLSLSKDDGLRKMKTLTFDDLIFEIRESERRSTLEIIVDRDGSLVLATPPNAPPDKLEIFVEENIVWVYTKLEEKGTQARPRSPKEYVSGEGFY